MKRKKVKPPSRTAAKKRQSAVKERDPPEENFDESSEDPDEDPNDSDYDAGPDNSSTARSFKVSCDFSWHSGKTLM